MTPEWMASPERACRGQEALFLYPLGEKGRVHEERNKAAQAVCGQCPFMQACRDHARANRETYGVWGGETEDERTSWLRNHPVVRPKPEPVEPKRKQRPRITDGTPCRECGAVMRGRTESRRTKADLAVGEAFHRARGYCDTCYPLAMRRGKFKEAA